LIDIWLGMAPSTDIENKNMCLKEIGLCASKYDYCCRSKT